MIHLRCATNEATGHAMPLCTMRAVPLAQTSSWMNDVTCEACRRIFQMRQTVGETLPQGPPVIISVAIDEYGNVVAKNSDA